MQLASKTVSLIKLLTFPTH